MSLNKFFRKAHQSTKTSRAKRRLRPGTSISLHLEYLEGRVAPATLHWIGVNSVGSSSPGLNGAYFNLNPGNFSNGNNGSFLIDNGNAAWLGTPNNYTPAATAVLTG